ncbi:MAG: heat-inducible transcriptional repressor HrcA [Nitrospiraceae bacterium]|nr:heat-inducible transcriptional repressor HrcA [Nitrospiraceae bacterium]
MLDNRNKQILCAIVQSYIDNPDPVGSRFITKKFAISLSPATIRNIMSDLEELGFLSQPHTSAGRVPTDKGYRFYVNSLISGESQPDDSAFARELAKELESIRNDMNFLLSETTKRLSNFLHYLGFALSPKTRTATFNRINLLKHKGNFIVTVLFTDEGLVNNKIVDIDCDLTQRDLNRIAAYLNSEFYGCTLEEISSIIIREMAIEKAVCDSMISRAMMICREAMAFSFGDIYVSGLSEVLNLPDFADLEKIKEISKAIEDKHLIIKLLDKISDFDSVQVIIGSENSVSEMKKFSIVAKTFMQGDKPAGSIGIIGPTRMDYPRAIAMIDITAKLISQVLSDK